MGWFTDMPSINFMMFCSCGYEFFPYCNPDTLGYSLEDVYHIYSQKTCPKCGKNEWSHSYII